MQFNIPILYEAHGQIMIEADAFEDALKTVEDTPIEELKGEVNHDQPAIIINYAEAAQVNDVVYSEGKFVPKADSKKSN
jgi:hypothetical protein